MNRRLAVLGAVCALCAALVVFDRSRPQAPAVVEAAPRQAAALPPGGVLPEADTAVLPIAVRSGYGRVAEGFFAPMRPPAPPPPPAPVPDAAAAPPVPPLPYSVIGKLWREGRWEVFLALGDASLIARAGEPLDANWRVLSIRPPVMELEYTPNRQRQTLAIGADFNE